MGSRRETGAVMNRVLSALFVLVWSTGFLSGPLATRDLPPLAVTTWRFVLAAVVLVAVAVVTRAPWPRGFRTWRDLAITGALMQGVQFGGVYVAIALGVPAALCALVLCLSPVLVAVAAGPFLGERIGRLGALGSAVAVLGAVIAGVPQLNGAGGLAGIAFLLLGLVGFAGGTLYQKKTGATMDLRTGTAVQLIAGTVMITPLGLLIDGGLPLPTSAVGVGALLWLVLINSIAGSVLLFVLLRRGTSTGVSGLLYVVPAVTALLAVPVLNQPIAPTTLAGLAITLVGVTLVQRAARSASRTEHSTHGGREVSDLQRV
jgi:drug/metabolite transporter (DMT)-like permease